MRALRARRLHLGIVRLAMLTPAPLALIDLLCPAAHGQVDMPLICPPRVLHEHALSWGRSRCAHRALMLREPLQGLVLIPDIFAFSSNQVCVEQLDYIAALRSSRQLRRASSR